jgi:hypothetical protein
MKVFRIIVDTGPPEHYTGHDVYACLRLEFEEDRKAFLPLFDGVSIDTSIWKPFKTIRVPEYPGNLTKPFGDRAAIETHYDPMVLSRRALDALLPHIGHLGQVLPLTFDECEYALFNITNVIDALDESASDIWRFPSSGRIGDIKRYAFKTQAVRDQLLFKIPQRPKLFAFCTDRFVKLVQDAKLTGFGFEKLWSDEATDAKQAA